MVQPEQGREQADERRTAVDRTTEWPTRDEGEEWRDEFRSDWSEEAIDTAVAFDSQVRADSGLSENFQRAAENDPDFRPSWVQNPEDGSAEKIVAAMNGEEAGRMSESERERMADQVAVMMTRNVWDEIVRTESVEHPDQQRIHEALVDRMEDAMARMMRGIVRGEPATVTGGLMDVATYDHQARQFNRTGIAPPDL